MTPTTSSGAVVDLRVRLEVLRQRFAEIEPRIHAFVPGAGPDWEGLHRQAEALSERFPDPDDRPPLWGLPVAVKDIFHVEGFPTRAGSTLPPEELAGSEGPVVRALRDAGALILGKSATTEFAYFAPGPTENPHRAGHTPGGSSSGSAAAAAGLCSLALGTQTIGSVIRPAAFCGVVGFKPSYDRLSCEGVIPLAPSYDHIGLFALSVAAVTRAAAALLPDWAPSGTSQATPERAPVLGIPEGPYLDRSSVPGLAHFEETAERLHALGCRVVTVPAFSDFDEIERRHRRLLAYEAHETHAVHRDWFLRHEKRYHPTTAALIRQGREVPSETAREVRAARRELRDELHRLMDRHGLDVWIAPPALGAAPKGLDSTDDPVMNLPWTQAGLPAIQLPAGRDDQELPMGLQVVGRFGADGRLLTWAWKLETALGRGSDNPPSQAPFD